MASASEQSAAQSGGMMTDIPPDERERLLSDLVDGDDHLSSFGLEQLTLATPEKAHLLNRIMDSPSVQSNRPTPSHATNRPNVCQLSAAGNTISKAEFTKNVAALDGPTTTTSSSQQLVVGSASSPSSHENRRLGTHGRSGSFPRLLHASNKLAGRLDSPPRQEHVTVGRVSRKDSYQRITSPRVLEAAVRSASRSRSPRRLNHQNLHAQRCGHTRATGQQSTNSGWSSEEGWTVEMSEDSQFASDEFDSDSDDEERHRVDQPSHEARTPATNANASSGTTTTTTPARAMHQPAAKAVHSVSPIHRAKTGGVAGKHCSYFSALERYEADDSDELDVDQGDVLICRELEGEDGDSWLEAKRLPFTGDAWKLVPCAVVRPMSHMELNHTFGSDDDDGSSLANDGESSVLLDDTDILPDDEVRTQTSSASGGGTPSSRSLLKINSTSGSPAPRARGDHVHERALPHSPMRHRLSVVTHSSHARISPRREQTSSPYSGESDYGTASDSTESFSVGVPGSPYYHGSSSAASTPGTHPRTFSMAAKTAATAASPALQLRKVFRQRSERSLRRHLAAVAAHTGSSDDDTSSDKKYHLDDVPQARADSNLSSAARARNEQGQDTHGTSADTKAIGVDPLDPSSLRLAQALVEMRWKQQLVAQAQKELEKARAAAEVARRLQHAGVSEHCHRLAERLLPAFPFCGRLAREVNHLHLHHPHGHPSVAGEHVTKPAGSKTEDLSRNNNREPKPREPAKAVHSLDYYREDPSHLARVFLNCCARGNTDQLATFLLAYPDMDLNVQADDTMPDRLDNGATGILLATRGGHHDAVKFLLDRRADPTLASHRCDSPLQAAARRGDAVLFAMILDAGDDVSLRVYDNRGCPGSDAQSSLMMCLHQHPLICLVENIAVEHCKAVAALAVPKSHHKTDTGSLFKRSIARKPSSDDSTTHVSGGRSDRGESDKSVGTAPSSSSRSSIMKDTAPVAPFSSIFPSSKSPEAQERADLFAALASVLRTPTQKWAENGLELAVGLNLGKSTPHINPLAGWVTRRGHTPSTRLRDLLIAGASLEPFGPQLRSRAWKTVLGLLGPPPSEDSLSGAGAISPATQAEKFEEARIRRYEGLCQQFLNSYKSDIDRCERLHRRADTDEQQSPPHASNNADGTAQPVVETEDSMLLMLRQIAVDLRRARKDFPAERLPALQRLLYVFAALHPSLGYVQGMHDIACAIYFHFHCERGRMASPRRDGRSPAGGGAPMHSQTDRPAEFVDSPRQRTSADWSDSSSGPSSRKDCSNTAERSHGGENVVEGAPKSSFTTSPLFGVCRAPDAVEASTFSVLNEVVGRCYLMQNIFQSKQYVDEFVRVFDAVLMSASPDVAHFLSTDGPIRGGGGGALTADMFIFPWIFTLFSQGVKFGAVWKIWDRLFTGWLPADFVAGALRGGAAAAAAAAAAAGVKNANKKSFSNTHDAAQHHGSRRSSPPPGSAQATMHPWRIGVNPAYLVATTVAIVVALREPLLACREFSTAMDILQSGLVILNGNNSFPASVHGAPGASAGDTNFYLSRFLDSAHDIYTNHALPIFRKSPGTFLAQENLASCPNAPTAAQHLKKNLPSKVAVPQASGKISRGPVTAGARTHQQSQQHSASPLRLGLVLKSAFQSRSTSATASGQPGLASTEVAPSNPDRSATSVQLAL